MTQLRDLLDTVTEYVVVTVSDDGEIGARGGFSDESAAITWASIHESADSGLTCHVRPLEEP